MNTEIEQAAFAPANQVPGTEFSPDKMLLARSFAYGEMMRAAYTLRADDDDWRQAGTLVRDVMDDAARERLVSNVVGHLRNGVSEKVLQRTFEYWRSIGQQVGDRIEIAVRNGSSQSIAG